MVCTWVMIDRYVIIQGNVYVDTYYSMIEYVPDLYTSDLQHCLVGQSTKSSNFTWNFATVLLESTLPFPTLTPFSMAYYLCLCILATRHSHSQLLARNPEKLRIFLFHIFISADKFNNPC